MLPDDDSSQVACLPFGSLMDKLTTSPMPASLQIVPQGTDASPLPTVSSNTTDPKPPRYTPSLTARAYRYQHRNATCTATDTACSNTSANYHDHQAVFLPARIPVANGSSVVPIALSRSTTVTPTFDYDLSTITLPCLHTLLITFSGPFSTVNTHLTRCVLPPFLCRVLPSLYFYFLYF